MRGPTQSRHSTRLWQRLSQDPQIPGTWYHHPLIAVFYPSAWLPSTGTGRAKLSPRTTPDRPSTSSDLQSHTEVNGARIKGPEGQHTRSSMPRQHNDINTTGQASWWSTTFSPPGMAEITKQPMDNTVHIRLPLRADRDPTRELPCALPSEATGAEQSPRERGSGSPSERCDRTNNEVGFLQSNVCSPQERWGVASHYQPQEVECVPLSVSLQDGAYLQCEGCYPGKRLLGEDRPKGYLPDGSSLGEAPQISQVCMGWPVLPVQVPTVLPSHSTQDLHKTPTTSSAVEMRRKRVRLIMYLDDTLVMAQTKESLKEHLSQLALVLQLLGFTLNQQKCVWEPTHGIGFLGFIVDSETQVISLPGDKLSKIQKECRSMSSEDRVTGHQLAQIIGLLLSAIPAILPAPLHYRALQRLRYQALHTTVTRELRIRYPSQRRGTERSTLVGTRCTLLQWSPHPCTNSRPSDNLGCLQDRMGSDMPRDPHRRSMGSTGKSRTHQPLGTQSSFPSIADICLTSFRITHPTPDRQHNSYCLHKPQGRYTISDPVRSGDRALGVHGA